MKRTLGIDLGTTNTVGAIDAEVLQHSVGTEISSSIPSVVAFPPSGATLVGAAARRRRAIDPKNTIFSAKRLMGQRWTSYNATKFKQQYPFELRETATSGCAFRTRAGTFTPTDIGAKVIARLLGSHAIQPERLDAVIAVPASFDAGAREATLTAARKAGLSNAITIEEPIATCMAYLTLRNVAHRRVAVYDLGGGTFDVALLDCTGGPARVIGHAGDPYLGGDDIDAQISSWVAERVLAEHGWDLRGDPEVHDRLSVQCERAKIRLGIASQTRIELAQIDPSAPAAAQSVAFTREQLALLCQELVGRTFLICDQVLRDAGLQTSDIDAVYLAGGTTLLPVVREGVARYFGSLPRCEFDPMEVVAIGASLVPL
jgi:molecular chaperone DnaK